MVSSESSMVSDAYGTPSPAPPGVMARTWQATLLLGVLTLILGIIVSFHPTGSLNVLAVLLGVLMIFSGIFHLIRVFDPEESHRVWLGIAGLLFIVIGVVLIRHLQLTSRGSASDGRGRSVPLRRRGEARACDPDCEASSVRVMGRSRA